MVWLSSGQISTLLSLLHASTLESLCNEGVLDLNVLREALNKVTSDQVIIFDLIGCLHAAGVIRANARSLARCNSDEIVFGGRFEKYAVSRDID